jgi:hypothetical protein
MDCEFNNVSDRNIMISRTDNHETSGPKMLGHRRGIETMLYYRQDKYTKMQETNNAIQLT